MGPKEEQGAGRCETETCQSEAGKTFHTGAAYRTPSCLVFRLKVLLWLQAKPQLLSPPEIFSKVHFNTCFVGVDI